MSSWVRQTPSKPAFPDMSWSKPERRDQAGKLLIIGGNQHAFSAPAEAYNHATSAGVGTCRVLLPSSLQRTVGKLFPAAEFGASTPSGSFAKSALGECLELAQWADAVHIAGDIGHNSETAIFVESLLQKYTGPITLTKDAVDYFLANAQAIVSRPNTLAIVTLAELQKLATSVKFSTAITTSMGLVALVEALQDFTGQHPAYVITKQGNTYIVACRGQVSTTTDAATTNTWRTKTAAQSAVWWLQHPDQPFQAITTSIVD